MTLCRTLAAIGLVFGMGMAAQAELDILPVTFTCNNGIPLEVAYFNATDGSGAAAMLVDNQLVTLRQVESGSGIQYESQGPAGSYILRSKGWDAYVTYLAAGANAASEQVVLENCSSR